MSPVSLRQIKKPISFQMGSKSLRKKKKSIELCLFLWSPGKMDLGFDSVKMRNLPCSIRSEIGNVSLFLFLSFF